MSGNRESGQPFRAEKSQNCCASAKPRDRLRAVACWGGFNIFFKGYMMQKVQMGGGVISPTVAAHVQKNSVQPAHTASTPKVLPATQIGGGYISPTVKAHVVKAPNIGGGIISPNVTKHVVAQSVKVSMGGGIIHPDIAKHIQAQ